MYLPDGERMVIFASKAGAPTNPAWYHNLTANPSATVEVGTATVEVHARVASGEERDRLYERQAELYPQFEDYAAENHAARYPSWCSSRPMPNALGGDAPLRDAGETMCDDRDRHGRSLR